MLLSTTATECKSAASFAVHFRTTIIKYSNKFQKSHTRVVKKKFLNNFICIYYFLKTSSPFWDTLYYIVHTNQKMCCETFLDELPNIFRIKFHFLDFACIVNLSRRGLPDDLLGRFTAYMVAHVNFLLKTRVDG